MNNMRAPLIQNGIVDLIMSTDRLRFRIDAALHPVGINLTQMSLLNHFSWQPARAQSITELTEVMAIHQPGVTKAVAALVAKGLLQKSDDAKDARVRRVQITPEGLDVLEQARHAAYPPVEAAFGSLDDHELAAFADSLRKLKASVT